MDDDPAPRDGLDREGFLRAFRALAPAERRRFVAALRDEAGWRTDVEGEVVTATRETPTPETERLLVPARDTDAARTASEAAVDAVLLPDTDPTGTLPADVTALTPSDLYRRARYGLDRDAADRLFEAYFDRPIAAGTSDGEVTSAASSPADRTTETGPDDDTGSRVESRSIPERSEPPSDEAPGTASTGSTVDAVGGRDRPDVRSLLAAAGVGALLALFVTGTAAWAAGPGFGFGTAASAPDRVSETATPEGMTTTTVRPDSIADRYAALRPTCERPPGLVIAIQIAALRENDPSDNRGIRTVWRFASPSNKRATGPFTNFVDIVTSETFAPLLNHERVFYGPIERTGGGEDVAQTVAVIGPDGNASAYRFFLSRQSEGDVAGCWMTDAVFDVELNETDFFGIGTGIEADADENASA